MERLTMFLDEDAEVALKEIAYKVTKREERDSPESK